MAVDNFVIPLLVSGVYPRRHDVEPTLAIETKRRITMSKIILSSVLGQIVGPIGQIIGSELGALLCAQLDGSSTLDFFHRAEYCKHIQDFQPYLCS